MTIDYSTSWVDNRGFSDVKFHIASSVWEIGKYQLNINIDRACCMLHVDGSNMAGDDSAPPPLLELLKYESYNKTDFIFEINKMSISVYLWDMNYQ